jgi:hypothetical protein
MTSLSERTLGLAARLSERDLQQVRLTLADGTEISGILHRTQGTRTLDFLNKQVDGFVAMTEAVLVRDNKAERASFVAINKAHIVRLVEG